MKRGYKVQIQHYVNPEEGVVVAVAHNCEDLAIDEIYKLGGSPRNYEKYEIEDTYRAVVRVRPGDQFDENVGKTLADKKLYAKLDSIVARKLESWANDVVELAKLARDKSCKYRQFLADHEAEKQNW